MNVLKHIAQQPFVAATALAALMHSTWSLGTLFAGAQPPAGLTIEFIGWLAPALLIAFALDIGQVVTSAEIRAGQRTRAKYATFAVFSIATYFLQWLYIAHHMPTLSLGDGVSAAAAPFAAGLRDAALWVIPALLPLSTLLYTFSHGESKPDLMTANAPAETSETIPTDPPAPLPARRGKNKVAIQCPDCDWHGSYKDERAAANALNGHRRHCTGAASKLAAAAPVSMNGNHEPIAEA